MAEIDLSSFMNPIILATIVETKRATCEAILKELRRDSNVCRLLPSVHLRVSWTRRKNDLARVGLRCAVCGRVRDDTDMASTE